QIVKKKNLFNAVPTQIADDRGIRAYFSQPFWKPFRLGSHEKLSAKDKIYCELPYFEYKDGVYDPGKFTEFSNSIFHFLSNEIAYQPCFMGEEIPLISYLDSLTFRVMPMLEKSQSLDLEKMGFLYNFFTKTLRLLEYENDLFMYQKALILVEIFKTYKKIYIRHLKVSLNNDEHKFKLINDSIFEKLSLSFSYSSEIDLLGRTLPIGSKSIQFLPEDTKITYNLVSILFKNSKKLPNPYEMGKFFKLNLINYWRKDLDYKTEHFERIAYILTVIANPISVENPNQRVLPETFLLDPHYYSLFHMLCKASRRPTGSELVLSPIIPLDFKSSINTKRHFHLKADGYNKTQEISSPLSKEKTPLDLMNFNHKFSSVFYFLTYLQEDHAFILSEAGMEIVYTFILKTSTYIDDDSKKALPLATKYFLFQKDKILGEVSTHKDDIQRFRLLANYQIILNRLMSIQKSDLEIGGLEHAFSGKFQPIFAFIKLNMLIVEEKFSGLQNSQDLYLSVISNF
ncbi:hypothetical protein DI09_318p10, partial [Mitosporidium daphniae]